MGIESNIITVVEDKDGEPTLSINQDELKKAIDLSNDEEGLKKQTKLIIANINNFADDYLDLNLSDDGEYSAEEKDAANAMQEIADKLNDYFNDFIDLENISTNTLIASLGSLNNKTIADILDLYRSPALHEKLQQGIQKVSDKNESYSHSKYGRIGSKRI